MRSCRLLTIPILLATAAPLEAQFYLRYDKRTRHSYLSIRLGSAVPHTHFNSPWYNSVRANWGTPLWSPTPIRHTLVRR